MKSHKKTLFKIFQSIVFVFIAVWLFGIFGEFLRFNINGYHVVFAPEIKEAYASGENWVHNDWTYRKKITLKQASTTLSNFPVLISLSDTGLASNAQADGDDILFTQSDGITRLSHDLESYSAGGLTAWVKIPTLSSSATTDIYMYYGNAATSSEETPNGVWDSNYIGVWHMSEDPTTVNCGVDKNVCDSTLNNNHATSSGMVAGDQQAAKINGGINFDGSDAYMTTLNGSSIKNTTQYTVSAWVSTGVLDGTTRNIFEEQQGTAASTRLKFGLTTNNQFALRGRDTDGSAFRTWIEPTVSLSTNTWYFVSSVFNADTDVHRLSINGNEYSSTVVAAAISNTIPVGSPTFGKRPANLTELWSGKIDEFRISNTARSSDWIAIEYDNQSATSTFYTSIGGEEQNYTISGTLYSDEGTTVVTSGKTVSMYLATSSTSVATSTISNGSGVFSFSRLDHLPTAGMPIVVWVDADTSFRASTVSVASSTSNNITGLDLYQNRVIVKHESESATSTTMAKLGKYDGDDDSDIQFAVDGSNNLTLKAGQMLYIWPGTHYDTSIESGGTITTYGGVSGAPDGDITLARGSHPASPGVATSSIITIGSGVSIAGSWFASSTSIFNHKSQTVTFTATTTGKSIYASSTPFYNLTFNGVDGTGGGWIFREMASTTNNFTTTDGTVTAPSWLSISGDFTNNGTFTSGTGTTTFDGTAAQTLSGTMTGSSAFNNVEFNNTFAGGASEDWYNADWTYRKKITLKQASTTVNNFPVLVSLSDTDLAARAQADGDDILFTSSNGSTRLPHEIENYGSGGINAWVKIPALSSSGITDIYMYYGNAATSSEETPELVWNGSYVAVWHMPENPTAGAPQILDSTANNNDGTVSGTWAADDQLLASTTATGELGGALYFSGLKTRDYIDSGAGSSVDLNDTLTASIWVNGGSQAQDTFGAVFNKNTANSVGWLIDTNSAGPGLRALVDTSAATNQVKHFGTALDNTWHRVAMILDSGNIDLFLDENQTIDSTYSHGTGLSSGNPVNIGRRSNGTNYYEGFLDEARIASTTLSADWLAIEYDNITATSTFYSSIGAEETDSGSGIGITFSNSATTTNFMILDGGVQAPPYLYVSGNYRNDGIFDANSGTTTFNGTNQQYISGFATGTNAFAGLEILNTTASTTFTATASSTGMMTAVPGARIEFKSGATTTVQNILFAGSSGNEIYLHPSTPVEEASWDLSNASNDGITYDITGQGGTGTVSTGIAFKSDGTKMYQLDAGTDSVYQYSLSTAWDISTLSYDTVSFSVTGQDTNPTDIAFKSDGSKMYIIGLTGDKVYEYPLSSAWNLSTASFNNASTSIFSQDGAGQGLAFKSDGTKMYIVGTSNDTVYQYSLSSAWDITTASYDSVSLNVSGEDGSPQGIAFKTDGTKLFMVGALDDEVHQYSLSSAWDLSTASYDGILLDVNPPESEPWGLAFKPDGTKLFLLGQIDNDTVYQYSLTGLQWGFEVPGGRSVSYVNVKDSNACYTSGNNITASNSTDGGNNDCWDISAPVAAGTLTISNHDAGQESNKFNTTSLTDEEFFRFKLTPTSEAITTTLVFSLSAFGVSQSDITNVQLFPDYNGDGSINGDDSEDPVGGSGTVSTVGNSGTITFSGFSTSTAMNYILQADISSINPGDELSIGLNKAKITAIGVSSGQSITPSGTVLLAVHSRSGGGSVGAGGKTGDSVTAQETQTGGSGGGGEPLLSSDDDNKVPGSSGTPSNLWSSGGNGIASDDAYASETTDDEGLNFNVFGFNVPTGDTINGIEVKIEASCVTTCGSIDVALTWDNDGTNATTTAKNTGTITTTDTIYTLGGSTDTWGRSWSASEFSDANFSVEVIAQPSGSNAVRIDAITARVYHQSTGGGGGGGGRSYIPPGWFIPPNIYASNRGGARNPANTF